MSSPTVRQGALGSMELFIVSDTWRIRLPNLSNAANGLILCFESDTGKTVSSISDDVDGTTGWAEVKHQTAGQDGFVWAKTNGSAGVRVVTIVFTTTTNFVLMGVYEVPGLSTAAVASALDGTPTGGTVATAAGVDTIAAPAITTAQNGSFVFQFVWDTGNNPLTTFSPASGWDLRGNQTVNGVGVQVFVQPTAGSITPTLTKNGPTATTYGTIAFAVKADATKGDATLPATAVQFVQHQNVQPGGTSFGFGFPNHGDCIFVAAVDGDSAIDITSVSDSANGAYNKVQATNDNGNGQVNDQYVLGNVSPSQSNVVTVVYNGTSAARIGHVLIYDIAGAKKASNPIGATAQTTGTQGATGDLATVSIAPQKPGGIIMLTGSIFNLSATDLLGGAGYFGDMMTTPASTGTNETLDECDLWGHRYHGSDLSNVQYSWSINGVGGVNTWGCMAAEILSAAGSNDFSFFPKRMLASRFEGAQA